MDDLRPRYTIAVHPEAFSPDVQAAAEKGARVGVDFTPDESLSRFRAEIRIPGAPPLSVGKSPTVAHDDDWPPRDYALEPPCEELRR